MIEMKRNGGEKMEKEYTDPVIGMLGVFKNMLKPMVQAENCSDDIKKAIYETMINLNKIIGEKEKLSQELRQEIKKSIKNYIELL